MAFGGMKLTNEDSLHIAGAKRRDLTNVPEQISRAGNESDQQWIYEYCALTSVGIEN